MLARVAAVAGSASAGWRWCVLAACLVALLLVLIAGAEINGARRWLHLGSYSLQPSEFAKPAFVVLSAWLLAEGSGAGRTCRRCRWHSRLYLLFAGLLALQPDVGQALLVSLVWGALFFLAGGPLTWFAALRGDAGRGLLAAYYTVGYVRSARRSASCIPRAATATRPAGRGNRSSRAACSAAVRARAPSRPCCPTPTTTSSSP